MTLVGSGVTFFLVGLVPPPPNCLPLKPISGEYIESLVLLLFQLSYREEGTN